LSEQQDGRNLARLRVELGVMLSRLTPPDTREAIRTLRRARKELVASSASVTDVARCDVALARAYALEGQLEDARALAETVLELSVDVAVTTQATAHCVIGQAEAASGDRAAAKRHFRLAVGLLTGIGADRMAAETWLELGGLFEAVGDFAGASNAYRSAAAATGLTMPQNIASAFAPA
jgi:tetratricopeptide (TPR) repeat protein